MMPRGPQEGEVRALPFTSLPGGKEPAPGSKKRDIEGPLMHLRIAHVHEPIPEVLQEIEERLCMDPDDLLPFRCSRLEHIGPQPLPLQPRLDGLEPLRGFGMEVRLQVVDVPGMEYQCHGRSSPNVMRVRNEITCEPRSLEHIQNGQLLLLYLTDIVIDRPHVIAYEQVL
jgi:hypothetical protein